jgi:signal transduction histidine kinase
MATVTNGRAARSALHDLAAQYGPALRQYCTAGGEASLLRAYLLGRRALRSGVGVLEIASLHQEELVAMQLDLQARGQHTSVGRRASGFLAECLTPFELTRRPFPDAQAALAADNQELTRRLRAALQTIDNAETQLVEQRRAAQARSDVIGTVSHELRTPLTSIHGSLDLLKAGVGGEMNTHGRRLLEVACRNCERLVRLVDDVLDLERLESGTMTFNMRPFLLSQLLAEAVEANSAFAAPFSVVLLLGVVPPVRVRVDGDQFLQVMTNLLSNAVKFSPAGGTVEIEAERREDRVRVAVTDHGPGVPPEFRGRIFQRFARGQAPSEKKGSGLGLSITRAILENMGGEIDFNAEPGRTTFHFDLPEWKARDDARPVSEGDTCAAGR